MGNSAIHWSSHTVIVDRASVASGDPAGILGSKPAACAMVFTLELSMFVVGTHRPTVGLLPRADEGRNTSLPHAESVLPWP